MFKNSSWKRRDLFYLAMAGLTGAIAVGAGKQIYQGDKLQALNHSKRDFKVVGHTSLKERAAAKGLLYGGGAVHYNLVTDQQFADSLAQHCGILVPEIDLKWDVLHPELNKFDFSKADFIAKFARTHEMLLRGHTLVWNQALPKWFNEVVNRQNAEDFLVKHITTTLKHYAGQIHSWDVVNEAIEPKDKQAFGLRKTPWLEFLGPDYIELAFRVAAQADPKTLLVYNEAQLEYDIPIQEVRRTALLKLLEKLKSKGTPIQALGIQSHLDAGEINLNQKKLRKFLADVASLDLKILITELDVEDRKLPLNSAIRDRIVANTYEEYLTTVLDERAVIGVLNWGLSDRYTWLSTYSPRKDGAPVRPLPLDSNLKPKLAWNAIARAFDHAPKR